MRRCGTVLLLVVGTAWLGPIAVASETDAFYARRIATGDGKTIENGVLVVRDGRVLAVGDRQSIPVAAEAHRHELGDVTVIPGLVIAETRLAEGTRPDERAIAPEVLAVDGFDPFVNRDAVLAGGVTTVGVVPSANRLIPGQTGVVKLAGDDLERRVLAVSDSLRILLSREARNPPNIFEPPVGAVSVERPLETTRPQMAATLGGAVAGVRAVFRAAQDPGALAGDGREATGSAELIATVAEFLSKKGTVRFTATEREEVRAALLLAREFDLRILLVDPQGLEPLLEQVVRWSPLVRGVVLHAGVRPGSVGNPGVPDPDQKPPSAPWDNARALMKAGVKVALRAPQDEDLPEILFLGGLFTRGGLSSDEVLRMLTLTPAELLGVEQRVGSLAAGKDADFVVVSGELFGLRSRVLDTYVNGKRVGAPAPVAKSTVVTAAAIYTGTGQIVEQGAIVIQGSIVRGVGRDVSAPINAEFRRFPGGVIVPGFIDLATGLGVGGPLSGTIPLQTRLGDQLDSADPAIAVARQGGVTTVLMGSTGSSPSPLVAFKLGNSLRVVRDPAAVRFTLSGNLTVQVPLVRRTLAQGKSYADAWRQYEEKLPEYERQLKEYEAAKAKYDAAQKESSSTSTDGNKSNEKKSDEKKSDEKKSDEKKSDEKKSDEKQADEKKADEKPADEKQADEKKTDEKGSGAGGSVSQPPTKPTPPAKPAENPALDPYRQLFAGKIPAMVEARQATAIAEAIQLFRDEFRLNTILIGADDVARDPNLVAKKQVAVAVGPNLLQVVDQERVNLPQVLANHQVSFGFQSQATTGSQLLPLAVQYAVSKGLGQEDALNGLTSTAAAILSLNANLGSLAIDKDADLVVLSGFPFEPSTHILAVMIDGQWVYEKEEVR